MSVKTYNIEMPKLDYQIISLAIRNEQGELVELNPDDQIFMSVKKRDSSSDYCFQKSLENGITYNNETQKYDIEINSKDTKDMFTLTRYYYDIVVFYEGDKPKQKLVGTFMLTPKYTVNEVVKNET